MSERPQRPPVGREAQRGRQSETTSRFRRSQDSRVPGTARRRAHRTESTEEDGTGRTNRSARTVEERTPERNPRKATARSSRSRGTPDGERGPGAGADVGAGAPCRQPQEGRGRATGTDPFGGQGFERARMQAAGSIDLPDRRAHSHHRHSIGADDGPRAARALDRLVPGPNPASARNPRRAIAGERDPRGGRSVQTHEQESRHRNARHRPSGRSPSDAGGPSADGPARRSPCGEANPGMASSRPRGLSRSRSSKNQRCVSGAFEATRRGAPRSDPRPTSRACVRNSCPGRRPDA